MSARGRMAAPLTALQVAHDRAATARHRMNAAANAFAPAGVVATGADFPRLLADVNATAATYTCDAETERAAKEALLPLEEAVRAAEEAAAAAGAREREAGDALRRSRASTGAVIALARRVLSEPPGERARAAAAAALKTLRSRLRTPAGSAGAQQPTPAGGFAPLAGAAHGSGAGGGGRKRKAAEMLSERLEKTEAAVIALREAGAAYPVSTTGGTNCGKVAWSLLLLLRFPCPFPCPCN